MALRLAAAVGALAFAEAQHTFNSCADHSSIGRNECVGQSDSCRWCGDYDGSGSAKCTNSDWALGSCDSGWKTCGSWTRSGALGETTPVATADGYGDDTECSWALRCPAGSTVRMTIAELDTEHGYDYVNVFDGSSSSANRLGRYSGSSEPSASIDGSGNTMLVTLESDSGITHNGLSASFTCMAPPPPPPSVCRWHDDGECDESSGTGLCDAGTDTADCTCRWANDGECDEDGTADGLCAVGTDTDDCSCRWTNDNQCDEPGGLGLCAEGTDTDDCACRWSNDGQCDDPSGTQLCPAFTDASDCSGSGRRLSTESLDIQPRRQLQVSPSLLGAMTINLCDIDNFCDRQLVPGKRHTYYQFWGATCSVAVPDGLSLTLTQTAEEATLDFSIDNIALSCGPINWAVAYRKDWAPDVDARGTVSLSSTNAAQNSLSLSARITQNSEGSGPGLALDPPTCAATHTGGSGFALQMQLDGTDLEGNLAELFEDDIKGAIVGALNSAVCSQTAGLPSKVPDLLDAVLASVHPDDARYQIKAAQKALVSSPEPKTASPELAALKARLVEHKQAQPPIQSAHSAEKAQAVQQKLLAQQAKTPEDHAAAGQARLEKLAAKAAPSSGAKSAGEDDIQGLIADCLAIADQSSELAIACAREIEAMTSQSQAADHWNPEETEHEESAFCRTHCNERKRREDASRGLFLAACVELCDETGDVAASDGSKLAVAAKGNPPPPLLASSSAPAEGTGDESPAVATQLVGGPGSLGPAWTRDEIEPPAGERDMGSYVAAVYTEEQQARLDVDEFGVSSPPLAQTMKLAPTLPGGFALMHKQSGKYLIDEGSSSVNVAVYSGEPNEQWSYDPISFHVLNAATGQCLDSNNNGRSNKGNVYSGPCGDNGNDYQKWVYNNHHNLVSLQTGRCLDSNGDSLYTYPCDDDNVYQQWMMQPRMVPGGLRASSKVRSGPASTPGHGGHGTAHATSTGAHGSAAHPASTPGHGGHRPPHNVQAEPPLGAAAAELAPASTPHHGGFGPGRGVHRPDSDGNGRSSSSPWLMVGGGAMLVGLFGVGAAVAKRRGGALPADGESIYTPTQKDSGDIASVL